MTESATSSSSPADRLEQRARKTLRCIKREVDFTFTLKDLGNHFGRSRKRAEVAAELDWLVEKKLLSRTTEGVMKITVAGWKFDEEPPEEDDGNEEPAVNKSDAEKDKEEQDDETG